MSMTKAQKYYARKRLAEICASGKAGRLRGCQKANVRYTRDVIRSGGAECETGTMRSESQCIHCGHTSRDHRCKELRRTYHRVETIFLVTVTSHRYRIKRKWYTSYSFREVYEETGKERISRARSHG